MIDLDHLDATLRLFDPDAAPDPVKPRLPPATKRAGAGEISRVVLDLLRRQGPMDGKAITALVMRERGQDPDDGPLFNKVHARVGTCLRGLRKRETVRSEYGAKGMLVWSVSAA